MLERPQSSGLATVDTLFPRAVSAIGRVELCCVIVGVSATVLRHGLYEVTRAPHWELGLFVLAVMLCLTVATALKHHWSLARASFRRTNRSALAFAGCWLAGIVAILVFGPLIVSSFDAVHDRSTALLAWSELLVVARGAWGIVAVTREAAAGGWNPALVLVLSFAILVGIGTILLMMPRARAHAPGTNDATGAPVVTALFTATSAACVTGLIVEPTGIYWSQLGQTVILGLLQVGGLGIMTCGALFAVAGGGHMQIRESATLRQLLESDGLGDVRRLLGAILVFTFGAEFIGAVCLSDLWSEKPLAEQVYFSVFHSISAFCNAGFSLHDESMIGKSGHAEVWGVMTALIIVGGLGFGVLYNVWVAAKSRLHRLHRPPLFHLPMKRARLTTTSMLVLLATAGLLLLGTVGYYVLESIGSTATGAEPPTLRDAWFQSVTFRTAGFNTVDHGAMQPATKLLAILLMFIGASPGSTGGGVRTVCFVLAVLAVVSILRGRTRVEFMHRTIPMLQVNRALAVISLGLLAVMTTTMLLVLFEHRPDAFLDHMFEATSAFATVGVSTGVTPHLSTPSKLTIIVTMFLGRVGPLTLLIALAGRSGDARYEYPTEPVALG